MGQCLIVECGTPNKLKFKPLVTKCLVNKNLAYRNYSHGRFSRYNQNLSTHGRNRIKMSIVDKLFQIDSYDGCIPINLRCVTAFWGMVFFNNQHSISIRRHLYGVDHTPIHIQYTYIVGKYKIYLYEL